MRRVVVTGMGAVTPLGRDVSSCWENLCAGKSGITPITRFDARSLPVRIAGAVPFESLDSGDVCSEVEHIFSAREQKRMDTFCLFGMCATHEALDDAGLLDAPESFRARTCVVLGSGAPGLPGLEAEVRKMEQGGRASPLFLPKVLGNLLCGTVAMRYGFHGRNIMAVSGTSGAHSVGVGYDAIRSGEVDCAVAGGVEGALCHLGVAGFSAMGAMAVSYNDRPTEASRPWDCDREGFVMSEGAGVLILEERECAVSRGAHIYGEISGFCSLQDNYSMLSSDPEGGVGSRCVLQALSSAALNPEDVGHINAHGSSTRKGDVAEIAVFKKAFGPHVNAIPITSNKAALGHLLGAAGAVELIFAIKGLQDGVVPATINTTRLCSEAQGLRIVCGHAQDVKARAVLAHSVGLGSVQTSIIVKNV